MKKRKKKTSSKHNNTTSLATEGLIKKIYDFAEPLCESEDIELVHIENIFENSRSILRVLIDKDGGVLIEDCVNISRQLNDILDVNLEQFSAFTLEVSSPGLDRPLTKKEDFQRFNGEKVKIKTDMAIEGQRNFKGVLAGLKNESVELTSDNKNYSIPFNIIKKARIISDFGE